MQTTPENQTDSHWTQLLDEKESAGIIIHLDFAKAFNKVLYKLESVGIRR